MQLIDTLKSYATGDNAPHLSHAAYIRGPVFLTFHAEFLTVFVPVCDLMYAQMSGKYNEVNIEQMKQVLYTDQIRVVNKRKLFISLKV